MDRRLSGIVFTVIFSIAFCNSCVGNFFADSKAFFTAFLNAPKKVGSVIPSSSFLANAMTRYVQRKDAPIKVLEVGAGTGALTKTIAARMGEGDLFDVIEIDPDLCDVLRDKFKNNKNVKVHCISISDWNPQYNYDFIVSSVPFNSFRSGTVKTILDKYEALIKPRGIISYVALIFMSSAKKIFSMGEKRADFLKNIAFRREFRKKFEFDRDFVFLNIPAAWVYHLQVVKKD